MFLLLRLRFASVSASAFASDSVSVSVRGVNSAREQDSSVGGVAVVTCRGVVHMEEEVQDRVQVEVGREEQGEGDTHGKGQSEE